MRRSTRALGEPRPQAEMRGLIRRKPPVNLRERMGNPMRQLPETLRSCSVRRRRRTSACFPPIEAPRSPSGRGRLCPTTTLAQPPPLGRTGPRRPTTSSGPHRLPGPRRPATSPGSANHITSAPPHHLAWPRRHLLPARARIPTMTRQGYWRVKVNERLTLPPDPRLWAQAVASIFSYSMLGSWVCRQSGQREGDRCPRTVDAARACGSNGSK
jgi:hypothetical protein